MHERGTYGSNGHSNGHGLPQQWSFPTVGADPDNARSNRLLWDTVFTAAFTGLGGYFGSRALPDAPNKGAIVGVATAFFFKLIMDQTSELKRMNNNLAQMR
jgi:hypothetical protein